MSAAAKPVYEIVSPSGERLRVMAVVTGDGSPNLCILDRRQQAQEKACEEWEVYEITKCWPKR